MPGYSSGVQTRIISLQISYFALNRAARPLGPSEDEAQRHVVYLLVISERQMCSTSRILLHDRLESFDRSCLFNVIWFPVIVIQ